MICQIGYKPSDGIDTETLNDDSDIQHQIGGNFTPKKVENTIPSKSNFSGVSIKWFPKKSDHGLILDFLVEHGLPSEHEDINIKDNGQVIISDLSHEICQKLCDTITGKKFNGKRVIYCNGIVPVTPEKKKCEMPQSESTDCQAQPPLIDRAEAEDIREGYYANEDFDFQPLESNVKSRLINGSASETDDDSTNKDLAADASDKWLSQNEKRRKKKGKRKAADDSPIGPQFFKKK